jgi:hypothetical protein
MMYVYSFPSRLITAGAINLVSFYYCPSALVCLNCVDVFFDFPFAGAYFIIGFRAVV